MKRIVLISLSVLVVVIAALLVIPGFIDWNKHKGTIITQAQNHTGLTVDIGGNIDMAILPYPHVSIEKLTVSNPSYNDAILLMMDKADVSVALLPLLSGKIVVDTVSLVKPDIRLEVAADGQQSWMTPTLDALMNKDKPAVDTADENGAAPAARAQNEAMPISLNQIRIRDGAFSYTDKGADAAHNLNNINLTVAADTIMGPYKVDGDVAYNAQQITLEAAIAQFDPQADSIALQAQIGMPAAAAKIAFAGVAAVKDAQEVQGDMTIEARDPSAVLAAVQGDKAQAASAPDILKKPLAVRGLLTASPASVQYKNMTLDVAGMKLEGNVAAANLTGEAGLLTVQADLTATQAVDLNALLPASGKTSDGKAADGKAASSTSSDSSSAPAAQGAPAFLPEVVTLPKDMNARITLAAPEVKYQGSSLKAIKAAVGWQDRKGALTLNAALPAEGTAEVTAALDFESASVSAQTGAVTLSKPRLTYTANLTTTDAAQTVLAFAPRQAVEGVLPALAGQAAFNGQGTVEAQKISLTQGTARLQNTTLGLAASFEPKKTGGRDHISVGVSANSLNADQWMAKLSGGTDGKAQAAPATAKSGAASQEAVVRDAAKKLQLPFDLSVQAALKAVTFKGTTYDELNVAAAIANNRLNARTLEIKDSAGNQLLVAGTVGDVSKLADIDLTLQGRTPDIKKLLAGFEIETASLPAGLNAVEALAELKGQAERLAFTANLKAMNGSVETTGMLVDLLGTPALSKLTLRARHPNYVEVMRLMNPEFKSGVAIRKTLDIFTSMDMNNKVYDFGEIQATLGPATFSGGVKADLSGAKPSVTANIQAGDVPLDEILGHGSTAKGTVQAQSPSGRPAVSQGERWSRAPLNNGWMHAFNLDLDASVKSLSYKQWQFTDAVVDVTLKDGVLTVAKVEGGLFGGKGTLNAKASSAQATAPLTVEGQAALSNVALESFVSAFSGSRLIRARGDISLNADIKTAGASVAALVSGLNGQGKANGTDFVIEGFDLARLSRTLVSPSSSGTENLGNLLGATMQGGQTSFETLTSNFTIANGIINIAELTLKGKDATITSPGTVNLPLWTIDMESAIKLTEPADAPVLTAVFKGSLDNPGQTFGRGAMDNYIRQMVGSRVQSVIQDKLGDKLEGQPLLQNILGIPSGSSRQTAPTPAPANDNAAPTGQGTSETPAAQPQLQQPPQQQQQAPAEQTRPATPEDALKGLLNNVIQGR